METYDIHFENVTRDAIRLRFTLHDDKEEEKQVDVIGTIIAADLNDAERRLAELLR